MDWINRLSTAESAALITGIFTLLAAAAGVFGVLWSANRNLKAEKQKREHDDIQREKDRQAEAEAARERREREDRTRYHLERVRAYSRFADAVNALVPPVPRPGMLGAVAAVADAFRGADWRARRDEFYLSYFQTEILGGEAVREAASRVRDIVYDFFERSTTLSNEEHIALIERAWEAMSDFLDAARIELDITVPIPPSAKNGQHGGGVH